MIASTFINWIETSKNCEFCKVYFENMFLKVATLQEEVTDPVKQPSSVVEISENQIDQVMSMLNEADPTAPESDPPG